MVSEPKGIRWRGILVLFAGERSSKEEKKSMDQHLQPKYVVITPFNYF
jgi:hypothetical protein